MLANGDVLLSVPDRRMMWMPYTQVTASCQNVPILPRRAWMLEYALSAQPQMWCARWGTKLRPVPLPSVQVEHSSSDLLREHLAVFSLTALYQELCHWNKCIRARTLVQRLFFLKYFFPEGFLKNLKKKKEIISCEPNQLAMRWITTLDTLSFCQIFKPFLP